MFTLPRHLIPSQVCPGICVCQVCVFVLFFLGIGRWVTFCDPYTFSLYDCTTSILFCIKSVIRVGIIDTRGLSFIFLLLWLWLHCYSMLFERQHYFGWIETELNPENFTFCHRPVILRQKDDKTYSERDFATKRRQNEMLKRRKTHAKIRPPPSPQISNQFWRLLV